MKKDLHPKNYRFVIFKDMSNGTTFLSRSTANSNETLKHDDGNEYPVIKLEISNTSHHFILVRMYWLILQVVLINLKNVTKRKQGFNIEFLTKLFDPIIYFPSVYRGDFF